MNIASHYQSCLHQSGFTPDPAQLLAVQHLQKLHQQLVTAQTEHPGWIHWFGKSAAPVTGLYLWGGVGRGKTWLMDLFFEHLPFKEKLRLHFHHFMQTIHDQLSLLKGQRDPLIIIAKHLAKQTRVICLDEFHVSDITDAMLLKGLLDALFKQGVTLVATSNLPPDDLYKHGLQREQFIPAIQLIKAHTQVVRVDGGIDHRLRLLQKADVWYSPITPETDQQLQHRFRELAPCHDIKPDNLLINYRTIPAVLRADDIVWFEFDVLCSNPRATPDYIEIARRFHSVILSSVPQLHEAQDDKATRFVNLIDEFYDRNIKLIVSAQTLPAKLYTGKQLAFAFQRTLSRLEEMRSHEYLSRAHRS